MKFNYSREIKEMEARIQAYIDQGMPEDMVQEMKYFERELFNRKRSFYRNHKHYLTDELTDGLVATSDGYSRYDWIDAIGNEELTDHLLSIPIERLELITQYVFDEKNQEEIAEELGISRSAIAQRIRLIKKNMKKFI